jgi:hypothetical protein
VAGAHGVNASVPVALFAFRRPDLLARALAALRVNRVPVIHAYSDGPRDESDVADVAEVRRMLRAVEWAEMRIVEHPVNVGLGKSLIGGISETLAMHEEIVVCEDDIEMAAGTYRYLLAALDRYRNEPRVMCVNGWTHPRLTPADARTAPHFSGRFGGWGWATWRRAWDGFPVLAIEEWRKQCAARGIDIAKNGDDIADWVSRAGREIPWDMAFALYMMVRDGLTLMPARTMTAHIGYDPRASHVMDAEGWEDHPEPPPPLETIRWPEVRENPESARLWRQEMRPPPPPSLVQRIGRRLARLLKGGGPRA